MTYVKQLEDYENAVMAKRLQVGGLPRPVKLQVQRLPPCLALVLLRLLC